MTTYQATSRSRSPYVKPVVFINAPSAIKAAAKLRKANHAIIGTVRVSPVQLPDNHVTYVAR